MKRIFYFIGILYIIYEVIWIISPQDMVDKHRELSSERKKHKGKKWDDYTDEYKGMIKQQQVPGLFIILWLFSGLLTFNWVVFLSIIVFNFIIITPISKLLKYSMGYTILHWINSVIGFIFGVFVIINTYHLKIDVYALIMHYLKLE